MGDKLSEHIKLRVTDSELAKLKRDAESRAMSVSEHIRALAQAYGEPSVKPAIAALREEIPELTTAAELPVKSVIERLPLVGEQHKAKPGAKTCKHGTQKGYRCWQCQGLANVEQ